MLELIEYVFGLVLVLVLAMGPNLI